MRWVRLMLYLVASGASCSKVAAPETAARNTPAGQEAAARLSDSSHAHTAEGAGVPLASPPSTGRPPLIIVNSGSTNALGFRVEVAPSGQATYQCGSDEGGVALPEPLATRLFADVAALGPLSQMTPTPCRKSASFGTSTFVELGGERSPDISCPGRTGDGRGALMDDINLVIEQLHLSRRRHRP